MEGAKRRKVCIGPVPQVNQFLKLSMDGLVRLTLEERKGGGVWDPKVCIPKMARSDVPDCEFCFFFPRWSPWSERERGGGGRQRQSAGDVCPDLKMVHVAALRAYTGSPPPMPLRGTPGSPVVTGDDSVGLCRPDALRIISLQMIVWYCPPHPPLALTVRFVSHTSIIFPPHSLLKVCAFESLGGWLW